MRAGTPKDVLSRLRWKDEVSHWTRVRLVLRHHGAPNDRKTLGGERLSRLDASFFELDGETLVPYHRILQIRLDDTVVSQRGSSSGDQD